MKETQEPTSSFIGGDYIKQAGGLVQTLNEILSHYSDKDWNYSRIRLTMVEVVALESPYLLRCELIDGVSPGGRRELRDVQDEIRWGENHSSELGILEIVSLRVNKAVLALPGTLFASAELLRGRRPIIRLVKRQELLAARVPVALWYQIQEVGGEEFENR